MVSGIGGTTRTFSPFGIVNTTLSATGGLGGTKRSFSPPNPDAPSSAPALATGVDGNLVDTVEFKQTTNLPGVYVKTGLGTAIPGATVTFSVLNPVTAPYNATPSNATVCDGSGDHSIDDRGHHGRHRLRRAGLRQLRNDRRASRTCRPTSIRPRPAGVAGGGITEVTVTACDPACGVAGAATSLNWLVETRSGNADHLSIESIATTAAAGAAFNPQPVLKVRDRLNNVVLTNSAVVTPSATGTAGSTGGLINSSTPTSASGVVTFSNLGIGGTVGTWKVKFTVAATSKPTAPT